jgi:hypothetical protein
MKFCFRYSIHQEYDDGSCLLLIIRVHGYADVKRLIYFCVFALCSLALVCLVCGTNKVIPCAGIYAYKYIQFLC